MNSLKSLPDMLHYKNNQNFTQLLNKFTDLKYHVNEVIDKMALLLTTNFPGQTKCVVPAWLTLDLTEYGRLRTVCKFYCFL